MDNARNLCRFLQGNSNLPTAVVSFFQILGRRRSQNSSSRSSSIDWGTVFLIATAILPLIFGSKLKDGAVVLIFLSKLEGIHRICLEHCWPNVSSALRLETLNPPNN
ncbi:unnamed protein product [Hymenolepis diminuta]|uniref:Uncharacterized protein n=1 Tax=Hymenolepis diminuta TaxID=6216 RepID=A0A564YC02_HYMDI|nr:unnamed protein product [Hymenolepis diminuta]